MNKKWLLPGLFALSFLLLPTMVKASKIEENCEKIMKFCTRLTGDVERCLALQEACNKIFGPEGP